jgi:DNA-binding MarR family transcriptional regulator
MSKQKPYGKSRGIVFKKNNILAAKLTEQQVLEIRAKYTGKWGQQSELAKQYKVTQGAISRLINKKSFKI